MRVALLTNFVPPYRISLFEALAARVERLVIVTSTDMESGRPWRPEAGSLEIVRQRTLGWRERQRGDGFADRVAVHVPLDTARQLARIAPDVVLSGELGARTLLALLFGRRRGVPVVVWATLSERTEAGRGALRRWLRGRILRRAAHVIVNGRSGERYVRAFGVPEGRVTRIPYTTAMAPFLALPVDRAPAGALRVLCVGNLIPRKAPEILLAAARAVASRSRPIALTFVGDGPLRPLLEREAVRGVDGLAVRIRGAVPYERLPEMYGEADVVAFPTLSDEWGLVVNEALASAVPVLGSPYSQAVEELVVDGRNGWLLEGCAEIDLVRGLERVLATSEAERAVMGRRARETASGLEPDAAAQALERVFRSVVHEATGPS